MLYPLLNAYWRAHDNKLEAHLSCIGPSYLFFLMLYPYKQAQVLGLVLSSKE